MNIRVIKNYVDKMRWVGGPKMTSFVHVQYEKSIGSKKSNIVDVVIEWPLSCDLINLTRTDR